jgi:hypothetical protein
LYENGDCCFIGKDFLDERFVFIVKGGEVEGPAGPWWRPAFGCLGGECPPPKLTK